MSEDAVSEREGELTFELEKAKTELRRLKAIVHLMQEMAEIQGATISWRRFPNEADKEKVLKLIEEVRKDLPLIECLKITGLSPSRLRAWKIRSLQCRLNDQRSCAKLLPQQLTSNEKSVMAKLYHDPDLQHLSLTSLALYAQRNNKLFCSAHTWGRYANQFDWSRKRARLYPCRKKTGIRAQQPNQIWHIDVTQIRLANGEKRYIQAVMDNFSRYVLSWHVTDGVGGMNTKTTIGFALDNAARGGTMVKAPTVFSDGGYENVNKQDCLM